MSHLLYTTIKYTKWVFFLLVSLLWAAIIMDSKGEEFVWGHAVRETGDLAWKLIIFTIFISLLHKLFPRIVIFNNLLPLRKYTGVFAFLIVLSHMVMQFLKMDVIADASAMFTFSFSTRYAAIFGTIGFLAMLPAFFTSTNWAVNTMKYRMWKNVQRLTHIAFIFAALHIGLIRYFYNGSIEPGPFVLLGLYVMGYSVLWFRRK